MQLALICEKCGSVHTSDGVSSNNLDGVLVVDFQKQHITFICQNKKCRHDNIFDFGNWHEQSKKSPLPRMRVF